MRKLAHASVFGSVLALAGFVPGCSDSGQPVTPPPTEANKSTISLALVVSLSGPTQALGEEAKRGAEVAVAQLNALGGVLNKRIELVIENDNGDPKVTRQKVTELAARGITLGIGPSTSTTALELKDLVAQDKVLFISPSATSRVLDKLTDAEPVAPKPGEPPANPVFFRTAATDVFLSAALTQYASTSEGGAARRCPSIVLVQQNDAYGIPIGEAVERYYTAFSLAVRRKLDLDPNIDNTAKLADAAAAAGGALDAQCQVVVAQPEVAGAYMRSFRLYQQENSKKRDWPNFITIGSDGFRQDEFIAAGRIDRADTTKPTAGEGSIAIAADTQPPVPEYSAFLNLFKARFPDAEPGRYGSTAYDATILLAAAIERAQTTSDHKEIRNTLFRISQGRVRVGPNRLADMFDLIRRGEDVNYEGASGSLDFTNTGHVRSAFGVWKIVDAAFVKVQNFGISELESTSF
jgi:branched-chain amino acid transport system substrate-binding protein